MVHNKIITMGVALAVGLCSVFPAMAGYQTIYVPDNYSTVVNGQTIIYQNQPAQTVIVQEPAPQTVYVRETTSVPSSGAIFAAGVGTFVGGVLLHSILGRHHHKTYRPAPPPRPAMHKKNHRR